MSPSGLDVDTLRKLAIEQPEAGATRALALLVALSFLAAVLNLVRRGRLREEYTPIWTLVAVAIVVLSVWFDLVRAITRAEHPVLRSTEAVAALIPLHLAVFAHVYLSISRTHPSAFTEMLDHVSALYFTMTVFATVGFGDIAPRSDGARLVAIVQMALNLILLGAGIRLLFAAARRGAALPTSTFPSDGVS